MSDFADILGRLQNATEQELSDTLTRIAARGQELQAGPVTAESAAEVRELAVAAQKVAGERGRRAEEAERFNADLAAIGELTTTPAEPQPEQPAEQPDTTETGDEPAEDTDPDTTTEPATGEPAPQESAVTASARRTLGGKQKASDFTANQIQLSKVTHTTKFVGEAEDGGHGLTRRGVAHAFARTVADTAGSTGRFTVTRRTSTYAPERHLSSADDWSTNQAKVQATLDEIRDPQRASLVAAGLCAPLEQLYDIRVLGEDSRPVRDALTAYQADRGGIQYRPALDGVTQTGGIGTWTKAQDVASPLVPKVCVEIACPGIITAEVEATYLCLTHSNMTTRFDPEFLASVTDAQEIAHARFAENKLLTQITTASKDLYATRQMGAARDILTTLDKVTAYYRNVHRLAAAPLRAILPMWAVNLIRADIARQMAGDGLVSLAVTDAMINDWLAARNIRATWHMDGINPAELTVPEPDFATAAQFYTLAADQSAVPGFPDTVTALLFADGDWLYLDGGELNMGVVRDSVLNGQNRFQTFSESFEIAAFRGVESLAVHMAVQPTGQAAATVDTSTFTD